MMPANTADGALFASDTWPMACGFDLLGYAAEAARGQGLSFYVLFDASSGLDEQGQYSARANLSAAAIQTTAAALGAMTENCRPDGVYLAGYYNQKTAESMSLYRSEGASMGYDNWGAGMRQFPRRERIRSGQGAQRQTRRSASSPTRCGPTRPLTPQAVRRRQI